MEQKAAYHNLTKKTEAARLALQRVNVALAATETAVDEKTAEVRGPWAVALLPPAHSPSCGLRHVGTGSSSSPPSVAGHCGPGRGPDPRGCM